MKANRLASACLYLLHQATAVPEAAFATVTSRPPGSSFLRRRPPPSSFSSPALSITGDPLQLLAQEQELPADFPRRYDAQVALAAVRRACILARDLQPSQQQQLQGDTHIRNGILAVTKSDLSPVTVADFAVQALVLRELHEKFPQDVLVAEENSKSLLVDPALLQAVIGVTGIAGNQREILNVIDLGQTYNTTNGRFLNEEDGHKRVWCVDPIDGTRGFLRGRREGGQYCVALALLENGVPTLGVLGCPNLPADSDDDNFAWRDDEATYGIDRGCIFIASKDGGCYQLPLVPSKDERINKKYRKKLHVTPNDASRLTIEEARFCIGVEKYGDPLSQCAAIAEILQGVDATDSEGAIVRARRMHSQAKYAVVARGGAEILIRLPKRSYQEWIWDHAAGSIVLQEAGGELTDIHGHPLDFSRGAKLPKGGDGILGTNGGPFHKAVLDAYFEQKLVRELNSMAER